MRKLTLAAALAALTVAAPAAAAPVRAATTHSPGGATMNGTLTPWVLLAPYAYGAGGGFGLGMRYQVEAVPQGFIRGGSVHDELGIEFGADWVHYSWDFYGYNGWTYNEISPTVGVAWNFWLTPQLALYPKIDLAFRFGTWSRPPGSPFAHPGGYGGTNLELAAGLAWRFADRVALRVEANTYALFLGVGFKL